MSASNRVALLCFGMCLMLLVWTWLIGAATLHDLIIQQAISVAAIVFLAAALVLSVGRQ